MNNQIRAKTKNAAAARCHWSLPNNPDFTRSATRISKGVSIKAVKNAACQRSCEVINPGPILAQVPSDGGWSGRRLEGFYPRGRKGHEGLNSPYNSPKICASFHYARSIHGSPLKVLNLAQEDMVIPKITIRFL